MTRRCLLLFLPLLACAVTLIPPVSVGEAHPPHHPPPRPRGPYSVSIESPSGSRLPTFFRHGQTFVMGRWGERYAIRLHNPTSRRVEAVVSVDGRDAVTGRIADYQAQRGYLVPPHGTVLVHGFRQSLRRVASFRFTEPSQSYSSRMGSPENVGVIGVAFFPERRASPPRALRVDPEQRRRPTGAPPPRSGRSEAAPRDAETRAGDAAEDGRGRRGNLGTEYGESRYSRAVEVPFRRQSPDRPAAVVIVWYDDATGLEARGIAVQPPSSQWPVAGEPRPFPANRFAPPPP